MRRRHDPMRNVAWGEWMERIDDQAYTVISIAEETHRGGIYRAGTFLLVERGSPLYRAYDDAREKLKREMRQGVHLAGRHYPMERFGMPLRGWVRDLRR